MSNIAIKGGATGTAVFTIESPTTSTDRTLTLPDVTATVITDSAGVLNIGSGQVYKDASGNVGIGTTSVSGKLSINGEVYAAAGSVSGVAYGFYPKGTYGNTGMFSPAANTVAFATTGGERVRIDSSGNVGIGTSSPDNKLTLASGYVQTGNGTGAGGGVWFPYGADAGTRTWRLRSDFAAYGDWGIEQSTTRTGTTFVTKFLIDPSGNVGIGTSSPGELLSLYKASGDPALRIQSSAGNCYVVNRAGTSAMDLLNSMNGPMTFATNNTERMRIDSSGNLMVGTTSAPAKLTVSGAGGTNVWVQNNINAGTGAIVSLGFSNANGLIGYVQTSGSTTSYITSSDYRLKTDIQPMTGASDRVLALNPVNFEWISSGERVDGFLAHEAAEVVPEAVSGEKDAVNEDGSPKYQGIDQSKLVPLLTAALQEALARIETLEADVATLKGAA
jgi:hypothetical protein